MKIVAIAALLFFVFPGYALAQECAIAAYADAAGESPPYFDPGSDTLFSVYIVLFAEDTVSAVAYSVEFPSGMFPQARYPGPSGEGLVIDESTGTNVSLGECAIGFGYNPVVVDEYLAVTFGFYWGGLVTIGPNESQDPLQPQYVTCNGITRGCAVGEPLYVGPVPTNAISFGAVKSLYR